LADILSHPLFTMSGQDSKDRDSENSLEKSFKIEDVVIKMGDESRRRRQQAKADREAKEAEEKKVADQAASLRAGDASREKRRNR